MIGRAQANDLPQPIEAQHGASLNAEEPSGEINDNSDTTIQNEDSLEFDSFIDILQDVDETSHPETIDHRENFYKSEDSNKKHSLSEQIQDVPPSKRIKLSGMIANSTKGKRVGIRRSNRLATRIPRDEVNGIIKV